jgi:hypothetical protein
MEPTYVTTEMTALASAELEEEVQKELNIPDPENIGAAIAKAVEDEA